jgi:UDP-glucose 4-epimerase
LRCVAVSNTRSGESSGIVVLHPLGRAEIQHFLLTGAAGFIGGSLASRLADRAGTKLVLVDKLNPEEGDEYFRALISRPNVSFVQADLTAPGCLEDLPRDIDVVFHGAAILGVQQVLDAPDRVLEINAASTLNVFNFARRLTGLKRIVFASTSEVYAGTLKHFGIPFPTPESVPICVDDVRLARTSYALSKVYGEAIAFAWRKSHGVPVTVVRYHNVYGPRMGFRHVVPQTFVKIARSTGSVDVPSAHHTRAFCYVEDAVEATILCWESGQAEGQVVNIGSSVEEISIRRLVEKIASTMGREIIIREMPETAGSPSRRCPDTSNLKRLTGFSAGVSLDEGLQGTYAWYRERLS